MEFDEYSNWILQDLFREKGRRSPAEGLLHELRHAQGFLHNPSQHHKLSQKPFSGYDNAEENRVIRNVENPAAVQLGGIRRTHHRGKFVKTKCITCRY